MIHRSEFKGPGDRDLDDHRASDSREPSEAYSDETHEMFSHHHGHEVVDKPQILIVDHHSQPENYVRLRRLDSPQGVVLSAAREIQLLTKGQLYMAITDPMWRSVAAIVLPTCWEGL